MTKKRRALVLAGGGYVGSSWEIGLVAGMAEVGVDLRNADLLVGTSSGARVALELTSGRPLDAAYRDRAEARRLPVGQAPRIDRERVRAAVAEARRTAGATAEILRRYGSLALEIAPDTDPNRRATVAKQLPAQAWPAQMVLITAVNAETGQRCVFDSESGIDLADAVIATTASWGVAPLAFGGNHYIDGGYYSGDNADLARGYEKVLILSLVPPPQAMRLVSLAAAVDALKASGSAVEVVHPDDATMAALVPTGGQMNPASGPAAAIAGRQQGRGSAGHRVADFWL